MRELSAELRAWWEGQLAALPPNHRAAVAALLREHYRQAPA
ncbi:hypothetical protein [Deinococcus sp. Leaf326]|nr:hypothetical protein [Deinococcus sp. Leaf326]